ncbi:MAG: endonuclease/exonuclease/phosphatase family protein [Bacteroidales bacterium]|nr:endonuclease/exonuclease/phosphatase family protein [Bacteroidales bacterium]
MNGYSASVKDGSLAALLRLRYDVVCLQETHLPQKPLPENVAWYHSRWRCAAQRRSGVAIFTRDQPLAVLDSGVSEVDTEGRLIAVEVPDAWIVSAYSPTFIRRPQREAYRHLFDETLHSFVERLLDSDKPVVVCGDLNVTAADIDCHQAPLYVGTPNHTTQEREAFRRLLDLGLVDVWRLQHPRELKYSWMPVVPTPLVYRRQTGTGFRFDYILASRSAEVISSDILVAHPGSDHVPVVAEIRFPMQGK